MTALSRLRHRGSIAGSVALAATLITGCASGTTTSERPSGETLAADRTLGPTSVSLYVDPRGIYRGIAAEDARFTELAERATPLWLTSAERPAATNRAVRRYVTGAAETDAVAVIVVYLVPERDCGRVDDAGLSDAGYLNWIDDLAASIRGTSPWIVLEPDGVAMADECGGSDRLRLLAQATQRLAAAGSEVYLDGGHSSWQPVSEMTDRLIAAGIDQARGFATNVANHQSTADELTYAEDLRSALVDEGVPNPHYVIDTGRNGSGTVPAEPCNSFEARLGEDPTLVDDPHLDGLLWIKNPGFPDALCNGAPSLDFWPALALSQMGETEAAERELRRDEAATDTETDTATDTASEQPEPAP